MNIVEYTDKDPIQTGAWITWWNGIESQKKEKFFKSFCCNEKNQVVLQEISSSDFFLFCIHWIPVLVLQLLE